MKDISQNFKNEDYFKNLINKYSKLKEIETIKDFSLYCTSSLFFIPNFLILSLMFIHSIKTESVYLGMFFLLHLIVVIPFYVYYSSIKKFMAKKEQEEIALIEKSFFNDCKNDSKFIKNISTLVVDELTEKLFDNMIDSVMRNNSNKTFLDFIYLFRSYESHQQSQVKKKNKEKFLKELNIDFKSNLDNDKVKGSFKFKNREKVLEML